MVFWQDSYHRLWQIFKQEPYEESVYATGGQMKLQDYGVWFDIMHAPASARMINNNDFEHYVVPYTVEAIDQVIANSDKATIDIAVVVYGYETSNSWYLTEDKADWTNSVNDIRLFMRANSAYALKQKYKKNEK